MPNVDFINRLADYIETLPHYEIDLDDYGEPEDPIVTGVMPPMPRPHFSMAFYSVSNVGCIAAHARVLDDPSVPLTNIQLSIDWMDRGARLLGISEKDGRKLFCEAHPNIPLSELTPAQAARTLRYLAQTGIVRWDLD